VLTDELIIGEIVQLIPHTCRLRSLAGCLMVVSAPKPWGAQGFVAIPGSGDTVGGKAYYRAHWDEIERTGGMAVYMVE
jgi:hypothetical protein